MLGRVLKWLGSPLSTASFWRRVPQGHLGLYQLVLEPGCQWHREGYLQRVERFRQLSRWCYGRDLSSMGCLSPTSSRMGCSIEYVLALVLPLQPSVFEGGFSKVTWISISCTFLCGHSAIQRFFFSQKYSMHALPRSSSDLWLLLIFIPICIFG